MDYPNYKVVIVDNGSRWTGNPSGKMGNGIFRIGLLSSPTSTMPVSPVAITLQSTSLLQRVLTTCGW